MQIGCLPPRQDPCPGTRCRLRNGHQSESIEAQKNDPRLDAWAITLGQMSEDLLAAYDEHLRGTGVPAQGAWIEQDGPLLRVVGEHRGFVTGPRDLSGHDVDALIAASAARQSPRSWRWSHRCGDATAASSVTIWAGV